MSGLRDVVSGLVVAAVFDRVVDGFDAVAVRFGAGAVVDRVLVSGFLVAAGSAGGVLARVLVSGAA